MEGLGSKEQAEGIASIWWKALYPFGFPGGRASKDSACIAGDHLQCQETRVQALVWEDPLDNEMATHAITLAWKIPWTEDPGGLVNGVTRVRHNLATKPPPLYPFGLAEKGKGAYGCGCVYRRRPRMLNSSLPKESLL